MSRSGSYLKLPLVIVFKKTKRANAKVRMKVLKTMDIDTFLNNKTKVIGIPETAVILQIGQGNRFIEKYKEYYKL